MEPVVFVMLAGGILAGWLLGSAATRSGRAGRDVVGARATWRSAVNTRNFERWKTVRTFAVIGTIVLAVLWMAVNVPPDI